MKSSQGTVSIHSGGPVQCGLALPSQHQVRWNTVLCVQPPVGEALGLFAFSLFLNIFKDWFSFYLCDFVCVRVHVCLGVCRGDKRVLDPLKLLLAS